MWHDIFGRTETSTGAKSKALISAAAAGNCRVGHHRRGARRANGPASVRPVIARAAPEGLEGIGNPTTDHSAAPSVNTPSGSITLGQAVEVPALVS